MKNKIKGLVLILALGLTAGTAARAAGNSCYTMAEAEAEQGLRIHSELMVIGLNCQNMASAAGDKNLYLQYREFTAEHARVFADYESRLMKFYQRTGVPNPEAELNTLRTALANQISYDAARMRPDMFCQRYAPRISKVATMDDTTLHRWAATFYPSHPVSHPVCP